MGLKGRQGGDGRKEGRDLRFWVAEMAWGGGGMGEEGKGIGQPDVVRGKGRESKGQTASFIA